MTIKTFPLQFTADELKKIAEKAKEQNLSTKQFILNAIEEKMKG